MYERKSRNYEEDTVFKIHLRCREQALLPATSPDLMSFRQLVQRSVEPTELFWQSTLSRLLLSYVPMIDFISRLDAAPKTIASFGSGSCAHEAFLASAFPTSVIKCHDVTDSYIPPYLKPRILSGSGNISFAKIDLEIDNAKKFQNRFDFIFSIQTLEHIKEYRNFLNLLSCAVRPSGYLYIDAPYYHMNDAREDGEALRAERDRQWKVHEHYHLGFSPHKLMQDPLLSEYDVIAMGYYAYSGGDVAVMNVFRNKSFSRVKGSPQFTEGLSYAMKSTLDVFDRIANLDSEPYFERSASAFRLLLKKRG